jgi:RNA polymerase-binding transcription factor DksA
VANRTEQAEVRERIRQERSETTRLVDALTSELDEIIESVSLSNNDDEHDPDGATNGYERAKATAMLRHAQERLIGLDHASERLDAGTYGTCEACGGEIGAERLDALPTATRCATCAAAGRSH